MAIQMRRGALDKLDRSKLLPGEFAICEDGTVVICYAAGKTKVVTSLELENARVSADGTVYETLKERLDQEYNQLTKELLNYLKEQVGSGGTVNVSEGLKTILQRIQFEIKACVRDDSVCPNSYIDATDTLINNLGTGSDTPSEPEPPVAGGISASWSGAIATINNLKNLTVAYSGNVATVGV